LFSQLNAALGSAGLTGLDKLMGFTVEQALTKAMRAYAAELKAGADRVIGAVMDELQPMTVVSPNCVKAVQTLVKKLPKQMDSLLDALLQVGHAQLVRRAIAHELRFSCRLDSNLLCGALEGLNSALLTDIRKHYYNGDAHPLPDEENPLIAQVAKYCESAGINDPLTNIYLNVEAQLQPPMGLWLALLSVAEVPRFTWDRDFGTFVRRKAVDGIDGAPFIAGVVTLLKQMHPKVTDDYFGFLGQYLRSIVHTHPSIGTAASASTSSALKELSKSVPSLSIDTVNLILLAQQVARVAHVPERVLHSHVPPYLFDTIVAAAT
jgi:WASH complex subunit strumpellin